MATKNKGGEEKDAQARAEGYKGVTVWLAAGGGGALLTASLSFSSLCMVWAGPLKCLQFCSLGEGRK